MLTGTKGLRRINSTMQRPYRGSTQQSDNIDTMQSPSKEPTANHEPFHIGTCKSSARVNVGHKNPSKSAHYQPRELQNFIKYHVETMHAMQITKLYNQNHSKPSGPKGHLPPSFKVASYYHWQQTTKTKPANQ